jgi:GNAT superfamily N-acetyltransferase
MNNLSFRPAIPAERTALEDLQWRASLMWEDYRDALLENPDAIDLPLDQITDGRAIVAEMLGEIVGFAVVLPRDDGHAELDALFVEPKVWRRGIGRRLMKRRGHLPAQTAQRACLSSPIRALRISTRRAALP